MIPLSTDRPQRTTPLVNYGLIAVNVAIALASSARPEIREWLEDRFVLRSLDPQIWQFITYQFLHAEGIWHLAGNMLFLWVFGNAIEDRLGHTGYLFFYLGGGVVAGLGHCLASNANVLGASGSVSAVTGAFLALFPYTRVRILWIFFLISVFEIPSMWFIGFSFARDLFGQIAGSSGVAYMAHIFGWLFGLLVGLSLLWTRLLAREPYDLMTMLTQWYRRKRFAVVTRQGYNPWVGDDRKKKKSAFRAGSKVKNNESAAEESDQPDPDDPEVQLAQRRQAIVEAIEAGELDDAAAQYIQLRDDVEDTVLSERNQLDLANHLFASQKHTEAADAYQRLLKAYPTCDHNGHVRLMLGLTLARYLNRPAEARPILEEALEHIPEGGEKDLAQQLLLESADLK